MMVNKTDCVELNLGLISFFSDREEQIIWNLPEYVLCVRKRVIYSKNVSQWSNHAFISTNLIRYGVEKSNSLVKEPFQDKPSVKKAMLTVF